MKMKISQMTNKKTHQMEKVVKVKIVKLIKYYKTQTVKLKK